MEGQGQRRSAPRGLGAEAAEAAAGDMEVAAAAGDMEVAEASAEEREKKNGND